MERKLWGLVELSTNELVVLLDQVRLVSLDIVERAVVWREARRSLERRVRLVGDSPRDAESHLVGLMYQGENYLVKMTSDLAFLDDSPAIQHYVDGHSSVDNPFMLPIDDEGLEDRCLEAADRVRLEIKCAALVVMKPEPILDRIFRSPTRFANHEKSDLTALVNRARLIPRPIKSASIPLNWNSCAGIQPISHEQRPISFNPSSNRFELKRKFSPPPQGLPIPGSPRSELPDFEKLRKLLKGRIEPKQHVALRLVPQLPGKGIIGIPITLHQAYKDSIMRHLRARDNAALFIQRFFRGVNCRAFKLVTQRYSVVDRDRIKLDRGAAFFQARLRGKVVRDRLYHQTVLPVLQDNTKLVRGYVTKEARNSLTQNVIASAEIKVNSFSANFLNQEPVLIRQVHKTRNSIIKVQSVFHRPKLQVKKGFGVTRGFSEELRKDLAAKHIQEAVREKRTQPPQSLKPILRNTDHALITFQAHIRSSQCRKYTDLDELRGINARRRCVRVNKAFASALRCATDDGDRKREEADSLPSNTQV